MRVIAAVAAVLGAALPFLPWWSGAAPLRLDPAAPTGVPPLTGFAALGPAAYAVVAAAGVALVLLFVPAGGSRRPVEATGRAPWRAADRAVGRAARAGGRAGGRAEGRALPRRFGPRPAEPRVHAGAHAALALVGAALLAAAGAALARFGPSPAPGPWLAGGLGLAAVVVGLRHAPRGIPAVLAVLTVPAVLVAVPVPRPATAGPFVQLAGLDRDVPRSGATTLSDRGGALRALAVDGAPGIGTGEAVTVVEQGQTRVLALAAGRRSTPLPAVLGVTGRTVVRWSDAAALTATDLDTGRSTGLTDVAAASRPGPDGTVLVRRLSESTVLRWRPGAPPVPTSFTGDPATAVPLPDAVLAVRPDVGGDRLVRVTEAGTDVLAGGADPGCGLTRDARAAHLPGLRAVTPVGTDVWFLAGAADEPAVYRLDAAGALTRFGPLPGPAQNLAPAAGGLAVLLVPSGADPAAGLWQLPWSAPGEALPDTPADCVPDPAPAAPPLTLTPVADTGGDRLGVPLDAHGTWAAQTADGLISAVAPDGTRTPLGTRQDRNRGDVWPDGAGGAWWLEARRGADRTLELVHGTPGGMQRFGVVTDPAPRTGSFLVPDLGGAPPLLGTADGRYRLDGGAPVRVAGGVHSGGVVAPDGRAWFVRDGLVVDRDGRVVLGVPGTDPAATRVQLARGTAPADLVLHDPDLAVDAAGRLLVSDGGVLLAVDRAGAVTVLADDPRLLDLPLWTVRDGFAAVTDGVISRVDPPT